MLERFYRSLSFGLLIFSTTLLFSQDSTTYQEQPEKEESHSSFLTARILQVLPVKKLGSENDLNGPVVLPGIGFSLEGCWLFHKNIGVGGSFTYMESKQYDRLDIARFPDYLQFFENGSWKNFVATGGLFVSRPFSNFSIDAKLLGGYGHTSAYRKKLVNIGAVPFERYIDYSGGNVWAQTGISFRLDMKPGWSFGISYDYLYSKASVNFTDIYKGNPAVVSDSEQFFTYGFHTIGFGIFYNFTHYMEPKK